MFLVWVSNPPPPSSFSFRSYVCELAADSGQNRSSLRPTLRRASLRGTPGRGERRCYGGLPFSIERETGVR